MGCFSWLQAADSVGILGYLVVPFGLITQLALLGESFICPGSPWMFHEVLSSPSFFLLFSFLGNFRFMELFCLFSYFIYHLLHIDWLFC